LANYFGLPNRWLREDEAVAEREEPDSGPGPQPPDQPDEVLADLGRLRRQARAARHAYWFPLVLFGVLIAASSPFFVEQISPPGVTTWVKAAPLRTFGGMFSQPGLSYYWLAAIVTGLGLTGWWYRQHGARVGLRTPSRGFLLTGLVITAALVVLSFISVGGIRIAFPFGIMTVRGTFPMLIIAIVLWVLARAERSAGLAVVAVLFTGAALLADLYNVENIVFSLGWNPTQSQWPYTSLPGVLFPALVLLVAGGIAFVAQRRPVREPAR
jgi:hypothetical protein